MRIAGTTLAAYAPPAGLLLLAAGFTVLAGQFGPASRPVPQLVGGATALLCVLDILSRSDTEFGRRVARWLNPAGVAEAGAGGSRQKRQLVALAAVAGFVLALVLVGVLPSVAIFALLAFRYGAGQGWRRAILTAAAVAVLIALLFSVLLRLDLFPGLIFGGEW